MNLTKNDVDQSLRFRLKQTSEVYATANDDNFHGDVVILFKYFLDFSTAIETLLKIYLKEKYRSDCFAKKRLKLDNNKSSYYLEASQLKELFVVENCTITWKELKDGVLDYISSNTKFAQRFQQKSNNDIVPVEFLKDSYTTLRNYRNKLAHSTINEGVDFTPERVSEAFTAYYFIKNLVTS